MVKSSRICWPTLEEAVAKLKTPVEYWEGHCYDIASRLKKVFRLNRAAFRYGHYTGPVHVDSFFADRQHAPFVHHAWLEGPTGEICDPTRWAFTAEEPYIYVGPNNDEYDPGGNKWLAATRGTPPADDADNRWFTLQLSPAGSAYVQSMFNHSDDRINWAQAFHLANTPLGELRGYECEATVYNALTQAGLEALIPIDNRRMVLKDSQKAYNALIGKKEPKLVSGWKKDQLKRHVKIY